MYSSKRYILCTARTFNLIREEEVYSHLHKKDLELFQTITEYPPSTHFLSLSFENPDPIYQYGYCHSNPISHYNLPHYYYFFRNGFTQFNRSSQQSAFQLLSYLPSRSPTD